MIQTKKSILTNDSLMVLFVFLLPTVMLVVGYLLFPYPPSSLTKQLAYIPLFLGLFLLGIGFFWKKQKIGSILKILGWSIFSFYWATAPSYIYLSEAGDAFNAGICIIGVYVLMYVGYHEWLSIEKGEHPPCLNWIAGGTFIAGMIYFTIDTGIIPSLRTGLIEFVAQQSIDVLRLFGVVATREGSVVTYMGTAITIIFACTAIQSMVLFVGMNGSLNKVSIKRKTLAIVVTVLPVYFLNLLRNASVIFLVGGKYLSFELAHNVIFKILSLIALIILLLINFKITPELYDEITGIIDLPKRDGPVEKIFRTILGRKKQ